MHVLNHYEDLDRFAFPLSRLLGRNPEYRTKSLTHHLLLLGHYIEALYKRRAVIDT